MSLASGARVGVYEVIAPLAEGGMGQVYRARDTRLQREVALKAIRDDLARDAELLARFEREARLLASLNHPNIAVLYGVEEAGGASYLAIELVQGETLEEAVARGPMPLRRALEVGEQVAAALDEAHRHGIVHRDLKPANVRLTPDGTVKVLDFGLAKETVPREGSDSRMPTQTATTHAGSLLGTPSYMSPEQVRGQPAGRAADVWALACLLFELLTGQRAFRGATTADVMAGILHHEPELGLLPRHTPPSVRRLLSRCFVKQAEARLADVAEARRTLHAALADDVPAGRRVAKAWIAVGLASLVFVTLALWLSRAGSTRKDYGVRERHLTQLTTAGGVEEFPAFSPDGGRLVYAAAPTGGVRHLVIKDLRSGQETALTRGTFDDLQPDWSPDGRTVVFLRAAQQGKRLEPGDAFGIYIDGDVWAIDVASGEETRLVERAFSPAYSPDGARIAVSAAWAGPFRIWTVDRLGHNPQQVTTDASEAIWHAYPRWSPDGTKIVYQLQERTRFDLRLVDLARRTTIALTDDLAADLAPVFGPRGRSVYFSSDRGGGMNVWRLAIGEDGRPRGAPEQVTMGAGQDVNVAVAKNGRLAFATLRQNADLWRLPVSPSTGLAAGPPSLVVGSTREDSRGRVSPDGKWIVFNSDRTGDMNLWLYSLENGSVRQLTFGRGGDYQAVFFPDGARVAFFSSRAGNLDIWSADLRTGALTRLTHSPSVDINPAVSPDGKTIAYQSDATGRLEVWVMNADGSNARQLTRVGVSGHFVQFTRDGTSILFRCSSCTPARPMLAPLDGGDPRPIAELTGGAHMSFSPDGTRVMDVLGHKTLWVSPLTGGAPEKVFEFPEELVRIDYPVWSPDGTYVLFDRFAPEGGEIWSADAPE